VIRDGVELQLPAPRKGGWLLVLIIGALLFVIGGREVLAADFARPEPELLAYFSLGAGVFLAFFALLLLFNREVASTIVLCNGTLTLVTRGDRVAIPLASLAGVDTLGSTQGDTGHVLALRKKDGGLIELCQFRVGDNVDEVTRVLREAIENPDQVAADSDPIARLEDIDAIHLARRGDRVTLEWAAGLTPAMLLALGPCLGMLIIVYGFHRVGPTIGTFVGIGFTALFSAVVPLSMLFSIGVRQRVALDGEQVTIERLRFGRVAKVTRAPISSIVNVDYTHQLNTSGAMLTLRTETVPSHDLTIKAIFAMLKNGHQIPMGRLSLAAKIAVDLAIGGEIARRSGRAADQL
jgi:hypothetical protein